MNWAASIGTLNARQSSEGSIPSTWMLGELLLRKAFPLTVHLAEVPNLTYMLGSGKKYSKNIHRPASPWVKRKQDIVSPIRSVRSRQHAQASESTEYHLGPPAPPHTDITSMERQAEFFTCHEGPTKLANAKAAVGSFPFSVFMYRDGH